MKYKLEFLDNTVVLAALLIAILCATLNVRAADASPPAANPTESSLQAVFGATNLSNPIVKNFVDRADKELAKFRSLANDKNKIPDAERKKRMLAVLEKGQKALANFQPEAFPDQTSRVVAAKNAMSKARTQVGHRAYVSASKTMDAWFADLKAGLQP